jgi:hypothetical protein
MSADAPPAKVLDHLALAVSAASSPFVILCLLVQVFVRHHARPGAAGGLWTGIGIGGMVGVPLAYILGGVRRGSITDVHVAVREQRLGPFLAAIIGALLATLGLLLAGAPAPLVLMAAAVAANGVLFAWISRYWKISIHPSVLAGCVVGLGMLVSPEWLWLNLALPLVMWARVRRQRHNWAQGLAAVALAALTTGVMVEVYLAVAGPV